MARPTSFSKSTARRRGARRQSTRTRSRSVVHASASATWARATSAPGSGAGKANVHDLSIHEVCGQGLAATFHRLLHRQAHIDRRRSRPQSRRRRTGRISRTITMDGSVRLVVSSTPAPTAAASRTESASPQLLEDRGQILRRRTPDGTPTPPTRRAGASRKTRTVHRLVTRPSSALASRGACGLSAPGAPNG